MTWIDDNKGAGPWAFEKQSEKPYYNEGNLISNKNDLVWKMDFSGVPITSTHNPCGYWHNNPVAPPPSSCDGAHIGYTTLQMATDESQTLTVESPVDGVIYNWTILSGGGELSYATGISIIYTAPSSNVNCGLNPEISMSIGKIICDTIVIAINAVSGVAYGIVTTECQPPGGTCDNPICDAWCASKWCFCQELYGCDDEHLLGEDECSGTPHESQCLYYLDLIGGLGALTDRRTEDMINDGCCPAGLL